MGATEDVVDEDAVAVRLAELRRELACTRARIAELEADLATARTVGMAVGIVMVHRMITGDQADGLLSEASRAQHRTLREVAEDVVATGDLPA